MKIRNGVLIEIRNSDIKNGVFKAPENVKYTNNITIEDESNLKELIFESGLETLGDISFVRCYDLKKVTLPDGVRVFGEEVFRDCWELEEINIPNSVTKIGASCFLGCGALKEITIPSSVKEIERATFFDCSNLKKVTFNEGLSKIGRSAFFGCENLKSVEFPNGLKVIESDAFRNCDSLETLIFPKTLVRIENNAFEKCTKLKQIEIPNDVKKIENSAFKNCDSLSQVVLSTNIQKIYANAFPYLRFKYAIKNDKNIYLTNDESIEGEKLEINSSNFAILNMILTNWDVKDILIKECKDKRNLALFDFIYQNVGQKEFSDFIKNKNNTFFNKFNFENLSDSNVASFTAFFYVLGGFLKPIKEKHITKAGNEEVRIVDYAQKVGEFFLEKIRKKEFNLEHSSIYFKNLKFGQFKPEFTNFVLDKNNFKELMKEESKDSGFIVRCYQDFENAQRYNTSNKGSQRQLKPTITSFKKYFLSTRFSGVDDSNKEIAEVVSKFFCKQEDFDNAIKIDKERKANNIQEGILSRNIKESDVFDEINEYKLKIVKLNKSMLKALTDLANKKYTFEWLNKSAPVNYILGKLCSCCSHLEGLGYGIMRASIISPDVQNLVIRDMKGDIVAKSTLYINKNERYGVFNNVEINNDVPDEDKKLIYKKYKLAIMFFAQQYNKENPNNPLKQINVGMRSNDLEEIIARKNKKSSLIYSTINYGIYGIGDKTYSGDSSASQFIVWKNEDGKKDMQK